VCVCVRVSAHGAFPPVGGVRPGGDGDLHRLLPRPKISPSHSNRFCDLLSCEFLEPFFARNSQRPKAPHATRVTRARADFGRGPKFLLLASTAAYVPFPGPDASGLAAVRAVPYCMYSMGMGSRS